MHRVSRSHLQMALPFCCWAVMATWSCITLWRSSCMGIPLRVPSLRQAHTAKGLRLTLWSCKPCAPQLHMPSAWLQMHVLFAFCHPPAVAAQDCNLVLYDTKGTPIFYSGTYNQGTAPCRLVVSGAGGGGIAVLDAKNATLYSQGAYSPPGTPAGTLPNNAVLTQVC